jgi:hypothetical protein
MKNRGTVGNGVSYSVREGEVEYIHRSPESDSEFE